MPLKQGTEIRFCHHVFNVAGQVYKKDAPKAGDGNLFPHYLIAKSPQAIKKMPLKQGTEIL